jgi:hypothetical protein
MPSADYIWPHTLNKKVREVVGAEGGEVVGEEYFPMDHMDYDGVVNAADYTYWRDSLGSTTNLAADGNGDGVVNNDDYVVWQQHFGQGIVSTAGDFGSQGDPDIFNTITRTDGMFIGTRTGATAAAVYQNGSIVSPAGTTASVGLGANSTILVGARGNGPVDQFSSKKYSFALAYNGGLNASQVLILSNLIQSEPKILFYLIYHDDASYEQAKNLLYKNIKSFGIFTETTSLGISKRYRALSGNSAEGRNDPVSD